MAMTPFAHDSKERHEDKPGSARGSRRRRRTAAAAVLALLVAGLYAPQIVNAPPANAFGTINGLGQRAEHERITRAALACAPGVKSDGSCFEPRSIDQLAGHSGTFGAVGAPDLDESGDPNAHCDDADFLNVPGYPQSAPRRPPSSRAAWTTCASASPRASARPPGCSTPPAN